MVCVYAAHCLAFLWSLNFMIWPDGSHGAARDFAFLLGAVNLKPFGLLMTCVWNLPYGHDRHVDGRYYQLRACTASFFSTRTPESSVLWQFFGGHIYIEFKEQGVEFPGERSRSIEKVQYMKANPQLKGSKTSFGWFLAVVSTPMLRLRH